MATTWAATSSDGRAGKVAVPGWPTLTLAASVSLKPAFICSPLRSTRVMNGLELDDDELDDELDADDADELDDEAALLPLPETVWPTMPLTAPMVPSWGAFSTVPSSASCADARPASEVVSAAWAEARSPGAGGADLAALLAAAVA